MVVYSAGEDSGGVVSVASGDVLVVVDVGTTAGSNTFSGKVLVGVGAICAGGDGGVVEMSGGEDCGDNGGDGGAGEIGEVAGATHLPEVDCSAPLTI